MLEAHRLPIAVTNQIKTNKIPNDRGLFLAEAVRQIIIAFCVTGPYAVNTRFLDFMVA
jgi:hypothetical protein